METTVATLLGQQLSDFLLKQFAPPPGTKNRLGFLGTGVAVDPASFLSQGQVNPARVNRWLDIVLDPLGAVVTDSNMVESTPWTASVLMETIASEALCVAAPDSEAQRGFNKAKSMAMENMGGTTAINTAPLDWYDPAQVPQWPKCNLKTSTSTATGTGSETGSGTGPRLPPLEPPPTNRPQGRPLWAWRTLDKVAIANPDRLQAVIAPTVVEKSAVAHTLMQNKIQPATFMLAPKMVAGVSPLMSAHVAASISAFRSASPSALAMQPLRFAHLNLDGDGAARIAVERAPSAVISEKIATRQFSAVQAVMVSQAIAAAADQASTSSVQSSSLELSLSYLVVSLSRAPWWNDFLLLLDNWYIPGLRRAAIIGDDATQKVGAIPIAVILTSDVRIAATWSEADRAAASSNTHFGPWALTASQFTSSASAGEAVLTIPGIQAIACIYRELPTIPPQSDPGLPPAG